MGTGTEKNYFPPLSLSNESGKQGRGWPGCLAIRIRKGAFRAWPWEPFSEAPETSGACRTPLLNIRFVFSVRCRRTQSFQGIGPAALRGRPKGLSGHGDLLAGAAGDGAQYIRMKRQGKDLLGALSLQKRPCAGDTRSMRSRYTRQASRKVETVQGKSVHQKTRGMHHKNSSLQSSCDTFLHQKDTKKTAQNFTFD